MRMRTVSGVGFVFALALGSACTRFSGDESKANVQTGEADSGTPTDGGAPAVLVDGNIALQIATDEQRIVQGKSLSVPLKLVRSTGAVGTVTVTLKSGVGGLSASPSVVAGDQGDLVITASSDVAQGPVEVTLEAVLGDKLATAPLHLFVRGPAGSLDTTFGDHGFYREKDEGTENGSLAVGTDDSIYSALSGRTIRHLNSAGQIDPAYGDAGVAADVSLPAYNVRFLLNPDGSILLCGYGRADNITGMFGKYAPKGTPDTAFGDGKYGPGTRGLPSNAGGAALAAVDRWPDGEIVFAASSGAAGPPTPADFAAVNVLDALGRPKTTFGDNGHVNVPFQLTRVQANIPLGVRSPSVYVIADGDILVTGTGVETVNDPDAGTTNNYYSVVCQVQRANGNFNPWFGRDGCAVHSNVGNSESYSSVQQMPDGTFRVFVFSWDGYYWIYALDAQGAVLPSFGQQGTVGPVALDPQWGNPSILQVEGGFLLLEGELTPKTSVRKYRFRRLTESGVPDTSFGVVAIDNHIVDGVSYDVLTGMARQADGRVIVRGNNVAIKDTHGYDALRGPMFVARYWN